MVIDRYPGALWMPADPSNYRLAGRTRFSQIVIHCTDGRGDPKATARMWQKPKMPVSSAHFVVGPDGTIVQCVSIRDIAIHAHHLNATSIAIEHCARTPGELGKSDPGMPPTVRQLVSSARLCAGLLRLGGLEPSRETIVGHAEGDPKTTHRGCPESSGLLLEPYRILAAAEFAALTARVA